MRLAVFFMTSCMLAVPVFAMEPVWTRTTGQYRYECTPALVDIEGDGAPEILGVNVGGQVLAWKLDGADAGPGQDGLVAALPEGEWTSTPAVLGAGSERRYVFCSTAGLLVCLDSAWKPVWQHQLAGKTTWSRATPLVLPESGHLVIGDLSGAITCLSRDGAVVWSVKPGEGGCKTLLQLMNYSGTPQILAPVGTSLFALDTAGTVVWARDLLSPILSQPAIVSSLLVCAAGGTLYGLNMVGNPVWEARTLGEVDSSIAVLPRPGADPLIVCTGLWGNCYAFELLGAPAWTHQFRSKNRTRPLIMDANGDGALDIFLATYDQHAYVLDARGHRIDDVRVSGTVNGSPILLEGGDVLVVSTTLLAQRLRTGAPRPLGTAVLEAENVSWRIEGGADGASAVVVENPSGALLCVNLELDFAAAPSQTPAATGIAASSPAAQPKQIRADISARTRIVFPFPFGIHGAAARLTVAGADGKVYVDTETHIPEPEGDTPASGVAVQAALPYADMAWTKWPAADPAAPMRTGVLYRGEAGQAACVVRSGLDKPLQLRVDWSKPTREDGAVFPGRIVPRRATGVGTVNGEIVEDALLPLDPSRVLELSAQSTAKIWLSVDTKGAEAGVYRGVLSLRALHDEVPPMELPLEIEIASIDLPAIPLSFCTWDYLPNDWFPEHTAENLDDMAAHGVNIFPRTVVPKALWNGQRLEMDFGASDLELDRVAGRGTVLIQIAEPAIEGVEGLSPERLHVLRVEYLRRMRDHLKERGLAYDQYGLYPVDEPGLDYGPRIPAFMAAATLFREADSQMRIYTDPVPGLSLRDFNQIAPFVDIWCPNMRMVTGLYVGDPRMKAIMESGKPVWSYECIAQVKSISPLKYNRGNAWRAWILGLDGIGHWTYSTTQANHWFANIEKNDEYALVYPGERPVPSIRWEAVRDGLEDVAAVHLLEQLVSTKQGGAPGRASEAQEVLDTVRRDVLEFVDDAFIESRDYLKAGDRRVWHAPQDAGIFEEHRAAIARATEALLTE